MNERTTHVALGDSVERSCGQQQDTWTLDHGDSIGATGGMPDPYGGPEQPLRPAQIAVSADDVRIFRRDVASGAQRLVPALLIATLLVAAGLALMSGSRSLVFSPAPSALTQHKPDCSSHKLASGEADCVALKSDRETTPGAPTGQRMPAPTATAVAHQPSRGAAPQVSASTNTATPALQRNTTLPKPRLAAIQQSADLPKPTAVPETRPSTIEGWMVREVVGGTAVLEGPDGILRATSGDTVPGLGKVDSIVRWGNRWIVATSRGLISTP